MMSVLQHQPKTQVKPCLSFNLLGELVIMKPVDKCVGYHSFTLFIHSRICKKCFFKSPTQRRSQPIDRNKISRRQFVERTCIIPCHMSPQQ